MRDLLPHGELVRRIGGGFAPPLITTTEPDSHPDTLSGSLAPVSATDRSGNELRPHTLAEMVGQERLKPLLRRLIDSARRSGRPLDHLLFIGAAGTGKTTTGMALANELGRAVYMLDAPVSQDRLAALRECMRDADVLIVDEIHKQVAQDRRGVTAAIMPENFYALMEDFRLVTATGVVPFPRITIVGATTDPGLLPEPFLARFPLQPRLDPYTVEEMVELGRRSAHRLRLALADDAAWVLARACRANPRQMNSYLRNADALAPDRSVTAELAIEVVVELNATTLDGLTESMQAMLRYLFTAGRQETRSGVVYKAGVNSIATALGYSRDAKAIALYVEPELIRRGYIQVAHGGRRLTDAGVERARQLIQEA